jgi:dihydrofolate synthase/folylpolyglutamate synthase
MRLFPALAVDVEWGLERMTAALAEVGDPHLAYPTLHVGGTNGKGSVAATLASVLAAAGRRVGLYTSPHLCSFSERIQVDGAPLPEPRLVGHAADLRETITRHGLTFFEAATLLGFHAFARERVDVAVLEVGLGGRLDATNVARPLVAAVTNVALDHAEYLGDTLAAIAAEKAAIAKPGVPLVTAALDPELLEVVARVSAERGAELHVLDADRVRDVRVSSGRTTFALDSGAWGTLELETPLVGGHQAANTALAVAVLERLPAELRPDAETVRRGVARVRWPGRNQIERGPDGWWLFDVAHNPDGVRSLTEVLDRLSLPRPRVALLGVLADKDWLRMLPPLCDRMDRAYLTQPASGPANRRWDPTGAAAMIRPVLGARCGLDAVPDFVEALAAARAAAGTGTVVVTGSSHTVGDALRLLGKCPFGG